MKERAFGSIVASAVAGLFVMSAANAAETAAPAPAKAEKPAGYCQNASCKGHSKCAAHGNAACAGKNGCKGQGFLERTTKEACETPDKKKVVGVWKES